ncbi:T9SS type A sorting domain-containing protein [Flavicella sediminum]|uniref:T9SS type A sorting domain-containing protein n=1 Tax=Flavicella sediminum TaxID=2585141 RepID=UPI00111DB2DA|nr:T9SS type A sorting domain-containing protein [Flavicella sediminum]
MKSKPHFLKLLLFLCVFKLMHVNAQYTETMDSEGVYKNLKDDYGLVDDNASTNQSQKLVDAINDLSALGGGRIIIPKGVYNFYGIRLQSNIHILIEGETVIIPPEDSGTVFNLDTETGKGQGYIENVSIRGFGGKFIVDYHTRLYKEKQRAIIARMVKNFLIENMIVKDNYSTYCGIILSLTKEKGDISTWEVSRPTDGILRNLCHYKGNPGYGLVQCHGAQSVHFENLYSLGGVTLRLEVGANITHVGVFDITAKNIICENGRMALLMAPHSAKCGTVTVDGLTTISCTVAVGIGDGAVKEGSPDQTPGYFANDSSIKNIHSIFGVEAQFKGGGSFLAIPNRDYYDAIKVWIYGKFFDGPSVSAVSYGVTTYTVGIENVSLAGFPNNYNKPIVTEADDRPGSNWNEIDYWLVGRSDEDGNPKAEWISDKGVSTADYSVEDGLDGSVFRSRIVDEEIENDHFLIKVIGETCPNQNNGKIEIKAKTKRAYQLDLKGVAYSFTDEIVIENLEPNSYELCISTSELSDENCFSAIIPKAQTISAKAIVNSGKASVVINSGTPPYQVFLNGNTLFKTLQENFKVKVQAGDLLEVTSSKTCEGLFTKNMETVNEMSIYPNPVSTELTIKSKALSFSVVEIEILDLLGRKIVHLKKKVLENGLLKMNTQGIPSGTYFINVYDLVSRKLLAHKKLLVIK